MEEIIRQFIFCGGLFMLLLAIACFLRTEDKSLNRFLGAMCFSVFQLHTYIFLVHERTEVPPILSMQHIPGLFLCGPGLYIAFTFSLKQNFLPSKERLSLTGPVLSFLICTGLALVFPELFHPSPIGFFSTGTWSPIEILSVCAFTSNILYFVFAFVQSSRIFTISSLKREPGARILLAILLGSFLISVWFVCSYFFQSALMLYTAACALTLLAFFGFLAQYRFPNIFSYMGPVIRDASRNSRLTGVDLDGLDRRLDRLMGMEKIYREESLTLDALAEKLNIKPHQLSEFINRRRNMNFSRFVNSYRIEEAAQILLKEEGANILSVAFQVGFNSKASFNLAFKSALLYSPRDFIKQSQARQDRARKEKSKP